MADQPTEARLALYRKLSTEHLQTLLRSDLDGPPLDEATVDSILTVLAERRRTPADTSAAWQDFSAYYSTPDSPGAPVRRTRAHLQKAYTRLRIPIRVVSAAAAMFILIFALFPRVETGASDAPNAYITWTDEYLKIDALPHAGWPSASWVFLQILSGQKTIRRNMNIHILYNELLIESDSYPS